MKNLKLPRDFRRRMDQFWELYGEQNLGLDAKGYGEDQSFSDAESDGDVKSALEATNVSKIESERDAFYQSLNEAPKTGLHYLGKKEDFASFVERLNQDLLPIPWDQTHYLLKRIPGSKPSAPGRDTFHDLGLIYIQEPAAAMPVASVDLSSAKRILDLCAAPGGKTAQIYRQMNPDATLWANDIDTKRARILQQNMLRIGASDVLVSRAEASSFQGIDMSFDFIVLDAPCSGEALLRRKPQTAYQWHRYPPKVMARLQREILDDIWPKLEPGGRLLYATCTYNTLENEELITAFVSAHEDARIVPFDKPRAPGIRAGLALNTCPDTKLANRIFPHDGWGEGQFAILLEKDLNTKASQTPPSKPGSIPEPAVADLSFVLPGYELLLQDERLYALRPQELACIHAAPTMDFIKQGIYLGEYVSGDLEPSKSWASLQDPKDWPKLIDLTDQPQMLADLRSGTEQRWPTDDEGLYLLTVYDRGIGWLNIGQDLKTTLTLTQALSSN